VEFEGDGCAEFCWGTLSLFFYVAIENGNGELNFDQSENEFSIENMSNLEDSTIKINGIQENEFIINKFQSNIERLSSIDESIQKHLKLDKNDNFHYHIDRDIADPDTDPDLAVIQITFTTKSTEPLIFENIYTPESLKNLNPLSSEKLSERLSLQSQTFNKHFRLKFKSDDDFPKSTLSNMLGGIGYWHGRFLVKNPNEEKVHQCEPTELFSAVPSRPQFPRGFLWDEGFHLLLISKWSPKIAKKSLSSWLNRMMYSGWIPREQILGYESESRVPAEFIPQVMDNANPPTFFLAIDELLQNTDLADDVHLLSQIFNRLDRWFQWMYNSQQSTHDPNNFYWKGRSKNEDARELNPKTLTSGLDDYPRSTHPDHLERHIDMRCWLAFASKAMVKIAKIVALNDNSNDYQKDQKWRYYKDISKKLTDSQDIINRHWDLDSQTFADYGLHSKKVALKSKIETVDGQKNKVFFRKVLEPPSYQFVNDCYGYMSLFPVFLELLPVQSIQLKISLEKMRSREDGGIWTEYGLRSMSEHSPYYNARNTEHDPAYWRGPIWININILTIRALKSYANQEGPNQELAEKLYLELKSNIYNLVHSQWKETGFIWEQYDDRTGKGQGTRAFTGWSALAVLLADDN